MTDIRASIKSALDWCRDRGISIPVDIQIRARVLGVIKAEGDLSAVNRDYHDAITAALIDYFEGGGIAASRNDIKQAAINAFSDAFDNGWVDGGQDLPVDDDALDWIEARINQEFGFVDMLLQEAKELRKDEEFDYLAWISHRADGYTNTLREVYNSGKLRAMDDRMVTFDGEDGAKPCRTCKSLKGKRHKISWFVKRNYIPPHGSGLECSKGGHCQHYLRDDKGEVITV